MDRQKSFVVVCFFLFKTFPPGEAIAQARRPLPALQQAAPRPDLLCVAKRPWFRIGPSIILCWKIARMTTRRSNSACRTFSIIAVLAGVLTPEHVIFGAALDANCSCGEQNYVTDPPTRSQDKLNVHLVAHTHDDVGWCAHLRLMRCR